ncbi:acetylornithine deacetylase [Sulfitobacter donghicola]|uniref:Acetylornithine deacetylase n=1 Tax=Sulfitobacter donghicola DSW-25 = KCTC 12864 = JCM 14565 TaxID=1300350 RepID=A0A073II41_9RHOB|nr:acetylornithine deacetylase [Sulfitobacter donghicola]KEJ89230.1 acetylornithine deacetylase [Sulfitobacter donghicola DSW-25 = KCTC 12864 = JCM 14565]KIN69024.1 Acetylornithine deacetylase (ArgE) [Sulfitobacter donghicola DSW-25 = KCTC 12864 = JCM 14565]
MTRTLEILSRLVAFPTVSRDSNLDLIDWVQELLVGAGFEVTRIWSPCRQKAGLFARIGPAGEGGVCLSAHTDVVPVEGQSWRYPPFELTQDNNRVFGRGTTDMKGFLASALALAERAGKMALSKPLSFVISYDEEIGCVGIQQMLPELKPLIGKPDLVIVGEPTSMQVVTGHKGKAALCVTCRGEAGHSALAPKFVNAIHVAAEFVGQMRDFQGRLAKGAQDAAYDIPYSTVHIGQLSAGKALNIVPDTAELLMEFRHLAQTPKQEIQREVEAIAEQVSRGFSASLPIGVEVVNAYPGLDVDPDHKVVEWATNLVGAPKTGKVAFGTEAGFFDQLGLTALVIGPGDMARDGHKPDEGLCLSQLAACDRMMDEIGTGLSK